MHSVVNCECPLRAPQMNRSLPPFSSPLPRENKKFICQDLLLSQGPSEIIRGKDRQCWRKEETQGVLWFFSVSPKAAIALLLHVLRALTCSEGKTAQTLSPLQARGEGSCVRSCSYSIIPIINIIFAGFYRNIPYLGLLPPPSSCLFSHTGRDCVPSFQKCYSIC